MRGKERGRGKEGGEGRVRKHKKGCKERRLKAREESKIGREERSRGMKRREEEEQMKLLRSVMMKQ